MQEKSNAMILCLDGKRENVLEFFAVGKAFINIAFLWGKGGVLSAVKAISFITK